MGMGFAPTWLRQVSPPPASHDHFNHVYSPRRQKIAAKCIIIIIFISRLQIQKGQKQKTNYSSRQTEQKIIYVHLYCVVLYAVSSPADAANG